MKLDVAAELGIEAGDSSGANFLGTFRVQEELGADSCVETIFADDSKKHPSTELPQSGAP